MFKIKFDPNKQKQKSIISPEDLLPKTVENTRGELMKFDPQKIIESLIEETGLDFTVQGQIRARSHPDRDPRGHIITIPFWGVGNGDPVAQDDAKEIVIIKKTE